MPIVIAELPRKNPHTFVLADVVAFVFFISVCLSIVDAQKLRTIAVGRLGDDLALQFTPETIEADVGDMIQFQFYPFNHSTVEADFDLPCVPINNTQKRQGFFSGFNPLPRDTKTLKTFTIMVNTTDPIFFYCSQGRHCQQGFVGAINPTPEKSLALFKSAAALAPDNLSPGETPSRRTIQAPQPSDVFGTFGSGRNPNRTSNANINNRVTNVGAIVGGVLGGVVFMIIVFTAAVFGVMSRRDKIAAKKKKGGRGLGGLAASGTRAKINARAIGKPMLETGSGPFGSGRV